MLNSVLEKELLKLGDKEYRLFQSKLMPNVDINNIIGIRVPVLRNFAKEYVKDNNYEKFLSELPHKYYDENMLHGLIISNMKDYDKVIDYLDEFLPYVDNWAVCDILSPKVFKKNKDKLLIDINKWINSKYTYEVRFGIEMLMSHFLDDDFDKKYLDMVAEVKSDEYYINMMIAWFFSTALTKQYDDAIKFIENKKLSKWVHNKTIQKACESYRIADKQKEFLRKCKL